MGLFTNTEKKIASALTGAFTSVKTEVEKIDVALSADVKSAFEATRTEALAANDLVNALKADLQTALVKARDLHQVAMNAASAAQAAAEADVAKFKAMVAAHAADMNTQASQIVAPPAPAPQQ